jgi:hypothetical protein
MCFQPRRDFKFKEKKTSAEVDILIKQMEAAGFAAYLSPGKGKDETNL